MNYANECSLVRDRAVVAAREEIRLFCRILGYSNNDLNHLIGDDPHGIVDMQEGYRYFNMTDIHVLIADYARWLAIYKDNQTLRKVVDEWYYWSLGLKEESVQEWISVEERKPDFHTPVFIQEKGKDYIALRTENRRAEWYNIKERRPVIGAVKQWRPIINTAIKPRYCNLKNWLMGWRPKPEDCLPYYNEHQAQEQAAAQKRVEQAKADLEQEVKQFNEGRKY